VARGHQVAVYCRTKPPKPDYHGVTLRYLPSIRHKYLDTLAAAFAEAGRFADAVKTQEKAQEKALEDKSYVIRFGHDGHKRLQLYKDNKPFRTEPVKK
jgi:hypothetical protein